MEAPDFFGRGRCRRTAAARQKSGRDGDERMESTWTRSPVLQYCLPTGLSVPKTPSHRTLYKGRAGRCKSDIIRFSNFKPTLDVESRRPLAEFLPVCRAEDVLEGKSFALETQGIRIGLFKSNGRIFALSGRCPHAAGPLDRGWVEDGEAVCPLHRWRFRLESGRCSNVGGEWVRTFRVDIRQDVVFVEI